YSAARAKVSTRTRSTVSARTDSDMYGDSVALGEPHRRLARLVGTRQVQSDGLTVVPHAQFEVVTGLELDVNVLLLRDAGDHGAANRLLDDLWHRVEVLALVRGQVDRTLGEIHDVRALLELRQQVGIGGDRVLEMLDPQAMRELAEGRGGWHRRLPCSLPLVEPVSLRTPRPDKPGVLRRA